MLNVDVVFPLETVSETVLLIELQTPAAPSTDHTMNTETTVTMPKAIDSRNDTFITDQGSMRLSRRRARRGPRAERRVRRRTARGRGGWAGTGRRRPAASRRRARPGPSDALGRLHLPPRCRCAHGLAACGTVCPRTAARRPRSAREAEAGARAATRVHLTGGRRSSAAALTDAEDARRAGCGRCCHGCPGACRQLPARQSALSSALTLWIGCGSFVGLGRAG